SRIIPCLRGGRPRETHDNEQPARGAARREESTHDGRISRAVVSRATRPMSVEEFRARARAPVGSASEAWRPRLVPVWRDVLLDSETPVAAFAKLRHGPFAFLLESAPAGGETWARYTFMGTAPRAAWKLVDGVVQDWTPER